MPEAPLPFEMFGPEDPVSPVVLSVPHAGRDYPLALRAALRVPLHALTALEDRHVDRVATLARVRETMLVQRRARAWIDLNRAEHERDPRIDDGANPATIQSAKLRGGLGLVPRRIAGAGEIWRRRLDDAEVMTRIAQDHRPYHAALSAALARARARFGVAILLDIHSMPSLGPTGSSPQIVLGDRFGRSTAARFMHVLEGEAEAAGVEAALNAPYSGGFILDRHADAAGGIHAIQIEFDRALYLDPALDSPGEGLERTARLLRRMIDAIADEALATLMAQAAE